jgi:hypothetical protein
VVDFTFSGDGLNVSYDETSFDGTPRFRYMGREFVGDAISTVVIPDLGKVVSVTIDLTVDTGSETLSILIPTVEPPPDTHPVSIKLTAL